MLRVFLQEISRLEAVCKDAADGVAILAHVPPKKDDRLSQLASQLERRGRPGLASDLMKLVALEEKFRSLQRRGSNASAASVTSTGSHGAAPSSAGPDGRRRAGSVSDEPADLSLSLLPVESRLALSYREFLVKVQRDGEARSIIGTSFASIDTPCALACSDLEKTGAIVLRRLAQSRQTQVQTSSINSGPSGAAAASVDSQARITVAERDIALLNEELKRKRRQSARDQSALEKQIMDAKADIEALVGASDGAYNTIQSDRSRTLSKLSVDHVESEATLEAEFHRLTSEHGEAARAHGDAESAQRKRRARALEEAETAIKEYDAAIGAINAEIRTTKALLVRDAPILADLKQYYEKSEAEAQRRKKEAHDAYWKFLHKMEDHVLNVVMAVARIKLWWEEKKKRDPSRGTMAAQKLRKAADASRNSSRAGGSAPPASRGSGPPASRTGTAAIANAARPGSGASRPETAASTGSKKSIK